MSQLRSRLNQIYGRTSGPNRLRERLDKLERRRNPARLSEYLGGSWKPDQVFTVERRFPLAHNHGGISLGAIEGISCEAVRLLSGRGFSSFDPRKTLFLDTETTGLAGGAGTCIFLTGVGCFENGHFVIRQLFLPGYESEKAYLAELNQLCDGGRFKHLVSFNGKSYDLNLLENRFVMARLSSPFEDYDHLDLVHPSRLLWRGCFSDCALQTLESRLLGLRRTGDIPSSLIPGIYFRYLNSGQVRGLRRVFKHNRTDLLTLVSLLCLSGRLIDQPDEKLHVSPLRACRLHLLRGNWEKAKELLEASWREDPSGTSPELVYRLALLKKKTGEMQQALDLFLRLASRGPHPPLEAFEEAAKILEHHEGDFAKALEIVEQGLEFNPSPELQHRRHRLECRLRGEKWY